MMSSSCIENLPKHIVIIMDGNGRWAKGRGLPRAAGHRAGVKALRKIVEHCVRRQIKALTVYAFSSENWNRPGQEVGFLLDLFVSALHEEVKALCDNNVRLRFIGNRQSFPMQLQQTINESELRTANNTGLQLVVAANYGGRWDIVTAARQLAGRVEAGRLKSDNIDEQLFNDTLSLADLAAPDLFIRTGGEQRLSNYLLWQLAYTELYFTDVLWPEFTAAALDAALDWYAGRQRRFGRTSEQVEETKN